MATRIDEPKTMALLPAVLIYLGCMAAWAGSADLIDWNLVPVVLYLVAGLIMSKVVRRRLIANNPRVVRLSLVALLVSDFKIVSFLLWPIVYPIAFFFIFVSIILD
tara:strand:+ start:1028 stop:1345 length:318 start_codon:yes stop_codon:yes gene_type:complete